MNRILMRGATVGWWRFVWRYLLLLALLLLCGGLALNWLGTVFPAKSLFLLTAFWSALVHAGASLAVFLYVLNRKFGKSEWKLAIPGDRPGIPKRLWVWFLFYWRFILFSVAISIGLGALLPLAARWAGYDPVSALKYSKYIGNFSVLPASLFSFLFLMYRRERRRRLVLVSESADPVRP